MKFSFVIIFFLAALFTINRGEAQTTADSVRSYVVKVTNLHCDGDMPAIRKQLLNRDGIDEVRFTERNGTASTFTVTYHSAATTERQIDAGIESTPGCDDQGETPYRVKHDKAKTKR